MPKGPKGERAPADVVSNAVRVMRIATADTAVDGAKNEAAASLGKLGGLARAKSLSEAQRSEIARRAAAKRWADKEKSQKN